ncbi:helix-turn-helix domain-containing protein [Halomarina litorea]|uniref:helix-turn-helix domain-containing protein n=1 Tax=Halomarina litorea TaxID=2961595 RepID=UPI0020C3D428|nr:helix-turn-helix domain-containing protein [Halomarina sp. BCD28]
MGDGIHVQLAVDGVETCPAAALSEEVTVESVTTAARTTAGDSVGEATVRGPVADESLPNEVERVFADGDRTVYRFESDGECPCTRLPARGCPVRETRAEDGTLRLSFIVPSVASIRPIVADLRACCECVRVQRLTRSTDGDDRRLVVVDRSAFTERQYEVFRTAHEMGYFDRPRGATATDVAAALDIAVATFGEHLATAQAKLLDQFLDEGTPDDAPREA